MGLSRDSFCSWTSGSLLSFAAGERLPPPRLMVCFVAFADVKVLAWSEQNHEGWPPTLCMWWFFLYIYIYACALVCCKSNMLPLLCWPELPCLLLFLSRLSLLSWHLAPYPEDCESFGEKPSVCLASAPLRRVMLIPCTWSCDALENPPRRGPLGCSWD